MVGNFFSEAISIYESYVSSLPQTFQEFLRLFILVVLIVVYVSFIWKFHKFIGTKNIFGFNLNKYNKSSHPFFTKILAGIFYIIEYILLVPFIVFFWYAIFTFFLFFLAEENIPLNTILLVSVIAVASIRMCSYIPKYGEIMAKELAKIIPFTFLAVSIFNPLILTEFIAKSASRINEIPLFVSGIFNYIIFITIIEVILRFFEFIFEIFGLNSSEKNAGE